MDNGQAAEGLVQRARRGDQEAWAALYTSVVADEVNASLNVEATIAAAKAAR